MSPGLTTFVWDSPFFLPKITMNTVVGLMNFWLGLIQILSYKDFCINIEFKDEKENSTNHR
jgi:hypothetical protein